MVIIFRSSVAVNRTVSEAARYVSKWNESSRGCKDTEVLNGVSKKKS